MSLEQETDTTKDQFLEIVQSEDVLQIREFLNNQNISDVAGLIYELPDYETQIIGNMAPTEQPALLKSSCPHAKRIIQELPAFKTAELLNDLSADEPDLFPGRASSEWLKNCSKPWTPKKERSPYPAGIPGKQCGR